MLSKILSSNTGDEEQISENGDIYNERDTEILKVQEKVSLFYSAELKFQWLSCILKFWNDVYLFQLLIRKTIVLNLVPKILITFIYKVLEKLSLFVTVRS